MEVAEWVAIEVPLSLKSYIKELTQIEVTNETHFFAGCKENATIRGEQ